LNGFTSLKTRILYDYRYAGQPACTCPGRDCCTPFEAQGVETSLKIIKTSGDRFTDRPLHAVSSGVGAFVRELDEVMLEGKIDIAVHSMKDMPTIRPPTLPTVAVLKRDTPFDLLLTYDGTPLDELPEQSIIGTSSLRRAAQIKRYRPDLVTQDLRGNIDTRLRKLKEGKYDGILLAKAGLERMGWELEGEILSPDFFCPLSQSGYDCSCHKSRH